MWCKQERPSSSHQVDEGLSAGLLAVHSLQAVFKGSAADQVAVYSDEEDALPTGVVLARYKPLATYCKPFE